MKFVVYATGLKGLVFLQHLLQPPQFVLTYDNGELEQHEKILNFCREKGIPVFDKTNPPKGIGDNLIFVVGWQYILKNNIEKLVVFHDSYIPEMRGFSPTVTALVSGKTHLGVTALAPTKDLSKGPDYGLVYDRRYIDIKYPIKISKAFSIIGRAYADIANKIMSASLKPYKINYSASTYSMWRDIIDMEINWSKSSVDIMNKINALSYPYRGATTIYHNKVLNILDASVYTIEHQIEDRHEHIGKIFNIIEGKPLVVCGSGILKIEKATNQDLKEVFFSKIRRRFK